MFRLTPSRFASLAALILIAAQVGCQSADPPGEISAPVPAVDGSLEPYYPLVVNHVRWYVLTYSDTEHAGAASSAVTGTHNLDDGKLVYQVEFLDVAGTSITSEALTSEGAYIHRIDFSPSPASDIPPRNFDLSPGLQFMRFPLVDGDSWNVNAHFGDDLATLDYRVEAIDSVPLTLAGADLQDCFRVLRVQNGVEDEESVYCPDYGLVGRYEWQNNRWISSVLFDWTSARASVMKITASGENCEVSLQAFGFQPDEAVTVRVYRPEDGVFANGSTQLDVTGSQAEAGFTVKLSPDLIAGSVMLELNGTSPSGGVPGDHTRALALLRAEDNCR